MPMFEMTGGPGLNTVKVMWFHGGYLRDKFHVGQMVALYGRLEASRSSAGKFKMIQPQFEILPVKDGPEAEFVRLEMGRIVPVYEFLGGTTAWGSKLNSRWLRRVVWSIFEELTEAQMAVPETLPVALCERLKLPGRLEALREIHFPEAGTPMTELMSAATPGHRRLIFEERFYLELGVEVKGRGVRGGGGAAVVCNL